MVKTLSNLMMKISRIGCTAYLEVLLRGLIKNLILIHVTIIS